MVLEARLMLIGAIPNISHILERINVGKYNFETENGKTVVELTVDTTRQLYEVKRRLGGKRSRCTNVAILGISKG